MTPQVQPLTTLPGKPEETRFTILGDQWRAVYLAINGGSQRLFDFVTANDTGWFNHPPFDRSSGWTGGVESLAMGSGADWDNVLACRPYNADWLEVLTLRPTDGTAGISQDLTPWFVHRFTLVGHHADKTTFWADAVQGEAYGLIMSKSPVYIHRGRVAGV